MKMVVIGGGPAGMAVAVTAKEQGIEDVILLERHDYLEGVLTQCIHNGFGTQLYDWDYTGGEYAWLWKEKTEAAGVDVRLGATVLSVEEGWAVKCVRVSHGAETLEADAVIIATGRRERTLPQLQISGSRPAGIFTAGAAQLMMNMKNYLPGRSAVIPELEILHGTAQDANGIFICGNADFVHDLADHVTEAGIAAESRAAEYLKTSMMPAVSESRKSEKKGKQGNMVCTVCPKSCIMTVMTDTFTVTGNQCERGVTFARQEIENPKRFLTAIVKAGSGTASVRTSAAIDKDKMSDVMKTLKKNRCIWRCLSGNCCGKRYRRYRS